MAVVALTLGMGMAMTIAGVVVNLARGNVKLSMAGIVWQKSPFFLGRRCVCLPACLPFSIAKIPVGLGTGKLQAHACQV